MSEPIKVKTMGGTPIAIQEAAPADANEVFGNPRNFPMLWKKAKKPDQTIRQADTVFPTTTTVKPK